MNGLGPPGAHGGRDDRGLTLLEVLVVVGLSGLLLLSIGPVVTATSRATRTVDAVAVRTAEARTALEIITRTLRVAVRPSGQPAAVAGAGPTGVVVHSLLNRSGSPQTTDPVPTRVVYTYDGTCLRETATAGTRVVNAVTGAVSFTWTAAPSSRCVLRTATAPAFRYYSTAVLESGGVDTSPLPVPGSGLTDPDTLAGITAIEVTLTARPVGSVASTQVLGRVTLSNVINEVVVS